MPIRLEDDSTNDVPYYDRLDTRRHVFVRLANALRFHNIPALNFIIIVVLGYFLFKLTTKYTDLYMKSSVFTIIVTNLVLYGISETLAQTILSYNASDPLISFQLSRNYGLSYNLNDITSEESHPNEEYDELDDYGLERFIDYIEQEDSLVLGGSLFGQTAAPQPSELAYFQFNRLAGFMCWGIIMGIALSWWYKFLQIYALDPKFIEVLRKVLTDQLCYSPVSLFCFFTYGTMVLENGTWEDTKIKLSKIYFKTLIINYSVWFPIQFFNFLVVPHNFQVPFSSSISVLWNCFLSMRNSKS